GTAAPTLRIASATRPQVALAHAPLDADAALVALSQDLPQPLRLEELRELRERDPFAARRADGERLERRERVRRRREPHGQVEPALALEDLGHHPAARGPLDRVLDVLDVEAVAPGRLAIHA